MPYTLGNECAGKVVAIGEGVDEAKLGYKVGDNVAVRSLYLSHPPRNTTESSSSIGLYSWWLLR